MTKLLLGMAIALCLTAQLWAAPLSASAQDSTWSDYLAAAKAAQGQGDTIAAEKMYQGAIEAAKKNADDDQGLDQTLNALGDLYYQHGRYKEAEHLFEQLLPVKKRLKGSSDDSVAKLLIKLGNCAIANNKGMAKSRFSEAKSIMEKTLPENDPQIAGVILSIAGIDADGAYYLSAERSYKKAIEIYEANQPETNKDIRRKLIDALKQYANTLRLNDQGGAAKKIMLRVDELSKMS